MFIGGLNWETTDRKELLHLPYNSGIFSIEFALTEHALQSLFTITFHNSAKFKNVRL